MKNLKKLFTFMFVISMIFAACNKDTSLTKVKNIDPTEQKILDFKEKMKKGEKSGETMSIEDAVWNIEAALNYTHCNAKVSEVIGIDSVFVTINITNNQINFSDIIVAYDQLNADLVNVIGENTMRLANIELVENSNKSTEQTMKLVVVKAPIVGPPPITYIGVFGDTDYWHAFWSGKCGDYSGQTDKSAITQIPYKANLIKSVHMGSGYYTNVDELYFTGDFYPDYFFWTSEANPCLTPDEMNQWLTGLKDFAKLDNIKPIGKELITYDLVYDAVTGKSGWRGHSPVLTYGIWHSTYSQEQ